ncbi:hypothetical protein ACOAIL_004417, partial [Shigella flexneri]
VHEILIFTGGALSFRIFIAFLDRERLQYRYCSLRKTFWTKIHGNLARASIALSGIHNRSSNQLARFAVFTLELKLFYLREFCFERSLIAFRDCQLINEMTNIQAECLTT